MIVQLSYMHSEGILSGELKHGPLALVDENMPCVIVVLKDNTYAKCHNALQQVTFQLKYWKYFVKLISYNACFLLQNLINCS